MRKYHVGLKVEKKKFQKNFKNLLTKRKRHDIINKSLDERKAAQRTLKIKQHDSKRPVITLRNYSKNSVKTTQQMSKDAMR